MIRRPFLGLALAAAAFAAAARAQAPAPDSPEIERRVDLMIGRMTLEEKIDLIGGNGMYLKPAPSAGFPQLKLSDGPEGVRSWGPSTAYAGGIALAASWDPALAERMGRSMGDDARARGVHILLAPGVNINRAPMNGRNFEYFGEDPYLAARTAVSYIEGVQSRGVVATVKHFAANNSEFDRHNISSDMSERTLREVYLPVFEAAVKEAHVGAVMDSYNLINGVHSTQNPMINVGILKKEWGFDGILMSDWESTYDGAAAANAGLDLEMPRAVFMTRANLLPAIKAGTVTVAALDDKVRRIFRTAIRFGFLDRPQLDVGIPLYGQEGRQVALDEAREGIVLLKNEGGMLPLPIEKVRTLAIIGPDAWPAVTGGGGSSLVAPYRATGILSGLSDYLGERTRVLFARGLPSPMEIFQGSDFDRDGDQAGLKMEVFDNPDFAGAPSATYRVAHAAHWVSEMWTPRAKHPRSVRWSGRITPVRSGLTLFLAGAGGEDRYALYVDGKKVIEQPLREGQSPAFADVRLEAGRTVSVRMEYLPASDDLRAAFGYRAVAELISPDARAMAASSDAALVTVGFDPTSESEGFDRSFTLPWGQDDLIEAVAAANRHTSVAIISGGGVDMSRWLDRVPAVLQLWYPGQEGGTALAEILAGARSPEGRLPVTFDRSWEESPVHASYYPAPHEAGAVAHVSYGEGLFYGYRAYTTNGTKPLFPFGFGLSYTRFAFSNLQAAPTPVSEFPVHVSFDVTNAGRSEGAEVAQLYVGDPSAKAPRPLMELKGFRKVSLAPGETKRVWLNLDRRAFAYFDEAARDWRVDPGKFVIYVGDSSENTPLASELNLTN